MDKKDEVVGYARTHTNLWNFLKSKKHEMITREGKRRWKETNWKRLANGLESAKRMAKDQVYFVRLQVHGPGPDQREGGGLE